MARLLRRRLARESSEPAPGIPKCIAREIIIRGEMQTGNINAHFTCLKLFAQHTGKDLLIFISSSLMEFVRITSLLLYYMKVYKYMNLYSL